MLRKFSTSNTPKATAGKCFKRFVSWDLKELSQRTQLVLPLRSVANLDKSQKSQGTGCYACGRWDVLRRISIVVF